MICTWMATYSSLRLLLLLALPISPPEELYSSPKSSFGKKKGKNNIPLDTKFQSLFKAQSHYLKPLIIICLKNCCVNKFIFQNKYVSNHICVNTWQNMPEYMKQVAMKLICTVLLLRMPSSRVPFKSSFRLSVLSELSWTRSPHNHLITQSPHHTTTSFIIHDIHFTIAHLLICNFCYAVS